MDTTNPRHCTAQGILCCLALATLSQLIKSFTTAFSQCLPELQNLLLTTVHLLHSYLTTSIAQDFFTTHYPRYRIPHQPTLDPPIDLSQAWSTAIARLTESHFFHSQASQLTSLPLPQKTSNALSLTPKILFANSTSTTPSIGSFHLLCHFLHLQPSLHPLTLSPSTSSSELLSSSLPLLFLALSSLTEGNNARIGQDETLFWCWWCLQWGLKTGGENIEEGLLFTLVEVRFSSLSLSLPPLHRTANHSLLAPSSRRTKTSFSPLSQLFLPPLLLGSLPSDSYQL